MITEQQLNEAFLKKVGSSTATSVSPKKQRYWGGGAWNTIGTVLSQGNYITAGLLDSLNYGRNPFLNVKYHIANKITPADTLQLKNPVARFVADAVLDISNITGVGALTKLGRLKTGLELGSTVWKQAKMGDRALLSVLGRPVIKGEKVFGALTYGAETFKRTTGITLGRFGGRGVISSVRSMKNIGLDDIEEGAKRLDFIKFAKKERKELEKGLFLKNQAKAKQVLVGLEKYSKSTNVSAEDLKKQFGQKLYDDTVQLPQELMPLYKSFEEIQKGFIKQATEGGGVTALDDFQLSSIARKDSDRLAELEVMKKTALLQYKEAVDADVLEKAGQLLDKIDDEIASVKYSSFGGIGFGSKVGSPTEIKQAKFSGYRGMKNVLTGEVLPAIATKSYARLHGTKDMLKSIKVKMVDGKVKSHYMSLNTLEKIEEVVKVHGKSIGAVKAGVATIKNGIKEMADEAIQATKETLPQARQNLSEALKEKKAVLSAKAVAKEADLPALDIKLDKLDDIIEGERAEITRLQGIKQYKKTKAYKELADELDTYRDTLSELKSKNPQLLAIEKAIEEGERIFTRSDINIELRNAMYKAETGALTDRFSTDAMQILEEMGKNASRTVARKKFIELVATTNTGVIKAGDNIPAGYVKLTGAWEGYVAPKEIGDALNEVIIPLTSNHYILQFLDGLDKVINASKTLQTITRLAFHSKNLIGDAWNATLALGTKDTPRYFKNLPVALSQATRVIFNAKNGDDLFKGIGRDSAEAVEALMERGLIGNGWQMADIDNNTFEFLTKLDDATANIGSTAIKASQGLGQVIGDGAKIALYKSLREAGHSKELALEKIGQHLFDYSDITDFERSVMRRAFPYYTWSRKNIPLVLTTLVENPERIKNLYVATQEYSNYAEQEYGQGMDTAYLPEYLKNGVPVFVSKDGVNENWFNLMGFIPSVDIVNFISLEDTMQFMKNSVGVIKTPLEMVLNRSFFTNEPIKEYKGQKDEFLFMNLDPYLIHALKTFSVPNTINSLVGGSENMREIPLKNRLMNFAIGRTYGVNEQRQIQRYKYSLGREVSSLNKDAKNALKRGDVDEYKRIQLKIRQISNPNLK